MSSSWSFQDPHLSLVDAIRILPLGNPPSIWPSAGAKALPTRLGALASSVIFEE